MAYWFAGFFARPRLPQPEILPPRACWRTISQPFEGIGVRLSALQGEEPTIEAIEGLAREMGIDSSEYWIYLTYTCWAGRINSVYGYGKSPVGEFGPVKEHDVARTEQAYVDLMASFGVTPADATAFVPFRRGFWIDA